TFDTLANTYRFFALYAGLEKWTPEMGRGGGGDAEMAFPAMDRWIRSRLTGLGEQVVRDLDAYELTHASRSIGDFIVDDLSNWYVRRSRDRFWGSTDEADTRAAF